MQIEIVKDYYGNILRGLADLWAKVYCTPEAILERIKQLLSSIHTQVPTKCYGCSLVVPERLESARLH